MGVSVQSIIKDKAVIARGEVPQALLTDIFETQELHPSVRRSTYSATYTAQLPISLQKPLSTSKSLLWLGKSRG
jgi:hypothetical protein